LVTDCGLGFYPIQGDVARVAASDEVQAMRADNPLRVLLSFNKLKSLVYDLQKDFFDACAGTDAIVYHPGAAIGYFIAQHMKIPGILAVPFPMTPTREYPALIFYNGPRLGGAYNYLTHKIFEQIMWSAASSPVKQFWQAQFGRAPANFSNPFLRQNTRRAPTVISGSNFVFPRPADWPEHVYNTGYWFLDEEAGWSPSPELVDFLGSGKPPVYVGFGSVGDPKTAAATTTLVVEALRLCGQRGILATGWSGMTQLSHDPKELFFLESAPHTWLFPRMAAVVHHGGAGTTAAGLRAGVPAVVIPYSNDQPAWARRVYELGVAAKPLPRKRLTAERLAEAIQFALGPEQKAAAAALGEKIRSENGAAVSAKIICESL
jgi:sterol 3beta-glucosyltransferase